MVQLQLMALFVAGSNLAVTSLCWEGHYAALSCTSVMLGGTLCSLVLYFCYVGRDIMQPCLVLLLCWEGHYAALSCTSVTLGGTLCSLVLHFCYVGRDIMQPCLALLALQNTNYLRYTFSCSITLLSEVSKKLRYIETSGSAYPVTQYRILRSALLNHTSIKILTSRKYDLLRRVCNFVSCCVLHKY